MPHLGFAAPIGLAVVAFAAGARAESSIDDSGDLSGSATYVSYDLPPQDGGHFAVDGVEPTFVAPEVIGVPPAPEGPIGRPEVGAGLPPTVPSPAFAPYRATESDSRPYEWQLLPGDTMFKSFIAGVHAPRMAGEVVSSEAEGTLLETTIGGRFALLRKGTVGPNPQGWELQVSGAALTRLAADINSDVEAVDYHFALPVVYRDGPTGVRFGYDHLSSHVGDEFLIRNAGFQRINYVRDAMEVAIIRDVTDAVSVYGEVNYAFHNTGGSEPWHFQFGAEFQPDPVPGSRGAPVAAVNTLLRQEFGYEGNLGIVAGWQWQGLNDENLLRLAMTLYTGRSRQFSFYDLYETLVGAGLYYDF